MTDYSQRKLDSVGDTFRLFPTVCLALVFGWKMRREAQGGTFEQITASWRNR